MTFVRTYETFCPNNYLVGLLITGHAADRLDERMSGVVHPCLDGRVEGEPVGCLTITQLGVHVWGEVRRHHVVVLTEVREVG